MATGTACTQATPSSTAAVAHAGTAYRDGWFGDGATRLHYVEAGQGPLVLLIHGFPSFWYCWIRQLEALRRNYRVVAIDALGAGASAQPAADAAYALPDMAATIMRLARQLAGSERFVIIGHDWGAALAFAMAQAWPEPVAGVVGIAAPPYNLFLDMIATDPAQQQRSAYVSAFRALTPARIAAEALAEQIARDAYAGLVERGDLTPAEAALFQATVGTAAALWGGTAWYRANIPPFDTIGAQHHWPADDAPLQMPALMVWGDADTVFEGHFPDAFAARHAGSAVLRLPGIGHWCMLEAPAAVNAALGGFIARSFGTGDQP